jgi:hypothetical protein
MVRSLVSLDAQIVEWNLRSEPLDTEERELVASLQNDLEKAELELERYAQRLAVDRKVDHYAFVLTYLESQRDLAAKEIRRLQARKQRAERQIDRMNKAAHLALSLLPEGKGPRELRGDTVTLALWKSPPHVEVLSLPDVPPEWIDVTVRCNKRLWLELLKGAPQWLKQLSTHAIIKEQSVKKDDLRPILKGGTHVEGVAWEQGFHVVRR